ncbi:hypothetical protein ACJQWK_05640 [Exserohilum turcicum]|uniref:Lccl domain-containing protein n=1 Tax=Exserohilum turcicum (strain 28A) TaxID=671987 RepID=R0K7K9_EXST2|nr:uncharacterized protein SETTUDRAFT_168177 [Exserohilum turcica Et28A]EOA88968.1 hypothetical protein SETTUDRAFT_168177 [Exserohilum turcica Et28A]
MAAPENIDIRNLQGKWIMNKSLSDPFDPILALQGISWLTRKAIGAATLTQHLTQAPVTGEDGTPSTLVKIDQVLTGGLKGSVEERMMDWHYQEHTDWLWGTSKARNRYSTLQKLRDEGTNAEDVKFLADGWLKETEEGEIVEAFAENEKSKWTALQVWGFAEIEGKRMLTRKFVVWRLDKNEVVRARLVYDYTGAL